MKKGDYHLLDGFTVFQSATAYLELFNLLLERVNTEKTNHSDALEHRGAFKKFYEEIFPTASVLKAIPDEWFGCGIKNIFGDQSYDVKLRSHSLEYLEIASANFDENEIFRMKVFQQQGYVDGIAKVVKEVGRNGKARPVMLKPGECRLHDDVIEERLISIRTRITKKSEINYPAKTGLIVYYEDSLVDIDDGDGDKFNALIEDTRELWSRKFERIYLVGPMAKFCFIGIALNSN